MKKTGLWGGIFILLLGVLLQAQELDVGLLSQQNQETLPGKILSYSFEVTNPGKKPLKVRENINFPADWQSLQTDNSDFILKPGEKQFRINAFMIPPKCPAGDYPLVYQVVNQDNGEVLGQTGFFLKVSRVVRLDMALTDKPEMVIAGESFNFSCRLINQGNSQINIALVTALVPDSPIAYEPKELILEAGKSQVVAFMVKTDSKVYVKSLQSIRVNAEDRSTPVPGKEGKAGEKAKPALLGTQSLAVEVIPRVSGAYNPYFTYKTSLRGSWTDQTNNFTDGAQFEYSGRGYMDEASKKWLDFAFRAPDLQNINPFGERKEYHINFAREYYQAYVGYNSYALSPITLNFYYGRGARLMTNSKKTLISALSAVGTDGSVSRGGYFKYLFDENLSLKGNVLNRNNGNGLSNIFSLEAQVKSFKDQDIVLESARSTNLQNGVSTPDQAFHLSARGKLFNKLPYSLEKIYAGPDYFGYYNNLNNFWVNLSLPVVKRLKWDLSSRSTLSNISYDPNVSNTSTRENYFSSAMSYQLLQQLNLGLTYLILRRTDVLPPAAYDYWENDSRFSLNYRLGKFNFMGSLEGGKMLNYLTATTSSTGKVNANLAYNPNSNQNYTAFYSNGNNFYSVDLQLVKNYGISAALSLPKNWKFSLSANKSQYSGMLGQNNLSAILSRNMDADRSYSLRYSWFNNLDSGIQDDSWYVNYTVPIPLLFKRQSLGRLNGRVYDADSPDQAPIAKVIFKIGDLIAVSDNKGEFSFPSLPPGMTDIWLDVSSMSYSLVSLEKPPFKVEIKGGGTSRVEIGVVKANRITGRLLVYDFQGKTTLNEEISGQAQRPLEVSNFLSNTLVELSGEKETIMQVTDSEGKFTFDGVRPGKWTLTPYPADLPAFHYMDPPDFKLELKTGENRELEFKVLPKKRTIQIIDNGDIKIDPGGKKPGKPPVKKK